MLALYMTITKFVGACHAMCNLTKNWNPNIENHSNSKATYQYKLGRRTMTLDQMKMLMTRRPVQKPKSLAGWVSFYPSQWLAHCQETLLIANTASNLTNSALKAMLYGTMPQRAVPWC